MTNLRIALQAAQADLPDVVKTTVYVVSQRHEDLLAAWGVVRVPSALRGFPRRGRTSQGSACRAQCP
jgi:enamine deaminase RidA (YjgF/YER057c/UK114 family)